MLHNVGIQQFSWPENVREVIADQLGEYIVSPESQSQLEICYFKGNKCVWVQNASAADKGGWRAQSTRHRLRF